MVFDSQWLRLLIVADDPLARAGLAGLLSAGEGCQVVGQIGPEDNLTQALDVYRPAVLVWDLGWDASAGGIDALHAALAQAPDLPVVALAPDGADADRIWAEGLCGLLLRSAPARQIEAACVGAAAGLLSLAPEMAAVLRPQTALPPALPPADPLTERELEVLYLVAEGMPNKSIARRLNISDSTVKYHLNALMTKLHAQSRTEAVVRATRLGLIAL